MADVPPVLELRGLRKSFGALVVTDDVSLTVLPGELHALIGPNGAGKTTLIHQISGTLASNAGNVFFQGQPVTALGMEARAKLGLARTFQITSIVPSLSTRENVALCVQVRQPRRLSLWRHAASDEALNAPAREALAAVGLAERATIQAGLLSHGEKRALEIAMALALEPKAILFDEPMAGVGREESEGVVSLLRGLKGRYGMLLVEHDMEAVFSLADRISVLVYGRIIATGTPDEIRANPDVRTAYLGEEA
ncbi:MAG: ABC transporter ATP-binding protein [Bosea sp. (in: a-proteobacteria)]